MVEIAEVSQSIVKADVPVLFLDTCILLNIIQACIRRQLQNIRAAQAILQMCTNIPRQCMVVVSVVVSEEWRRNGAGVLKRVEDEVRQGIDLIESMLDSAYVLALRLESIANRRDRHTFLQLPEHLHIVASSLHAAALEISRSQSARDKANARVAGGRRPAQRGDRSSDNDCLIIEHCLEVCERLGDVYHHKRIFVSSDRSYCEDMKQGVHADLAADFEAVGLDFAFSLDEAWRKIKDGDS